MNNKDAPEKCGATLCCKATAELQIQVEQEKTAPDKSLAELVNNLENTAADENKNTKE